jgi:peroxiredoxin
MFCQEQVAQLRQSESLIENAGGRLVVIGNGAPHFIEGFREKVGFDGELYTDPSMSTYRALRLQRRLGSSVNLRTLRRAVQAYRAGNRQSATQGDPWQQGGVFVIDGDGEIVFRYPSEYAGDHPPISALLSALRRSREAHE